MNNYKFEFFTLTSFYILSSLKVFVGNNLLLLLLLLLKKKNISLSAQNGRILQKNLNSQWMMLFLRSIPLVSIYIIYINIDNFVRTNFVDKRQKDRTSRRREKCRRYFSSMNFHHRSASRTVFTNEAKKTGTRSAVGENVGASSYRSPASSVVIDPYSPCLSYTLFARHRDILGRHNGSRETPLSGEESNASEKYRSPLTSKRDSCATVIIQRQWTLRMAAYTRKLGLSATQCGKPPLFARPGFAKVDLHV